MIWYSEQLIMSNIYFLLTLVFLRLSCDPCAPFLFFHSFYFGVFRIVTQTCQNSYSTFTPYKQAERKGCTKAMSSTTLRQFDSVTPKNSRYCYTHTNAEERVSHLEIDLFSVYGVCVVFVSSGFDWSRHRTLCRHLVSLLVEFVHQSRVFGAFGPHHLTGQCLTGRVDLKNGLRRRKVFWVFGTLNFMTAHMLL